MRHIAHKAPVNAQNSLSIIKVVQPMTTASTAELRPIRTVQAQFTVATSRGQARVAISFAEEREVFHHIACILASVLFNLKMQELFIYLMAFA